MTGRYIPNQPLIYVAGPYRASVEWEVHQNIRNAESVALSLWEMGFAVICPHKNTEMFGGALPDHVWLDGDLKILSKCDAIFMMKLWQSSSGAMQEMDFAKSRGIQIFTTLREAEDWLNSRLQNPNGGIAGQVS